jgi:sugar/nucleoside kinase (ribokinase family)
MAQDLKSRTPASLVLLVLGHSNIDVQIQLNHMPGPGVSSPVQSRRVVYGGTACNIARHAASMGVDVRLWSRVGADFPLDWMAALEEDGVKLAFDEAGSTPTCFILTDADGEQSYMMDQGAMTPPYDVPLGILDGVTQLHICTGDPAAFLPIAKEAKRLGIPVAFDPGQEIHFAYDTKSFEALLNESNTFWCNEVELAKAYTFTRYADPVQFLDHVDKVIVTRGANGADIYTDTGVDHIDAAPANVVDTTGAGDAFRAGFYAGGPKIAAKVAAVVVGMQGPQPRAVTLTDIA